ncbi:hypothetical protein VMCG_05974 [Cytospora schulzeri]|uniref:Uncharacterized protein n=1 Tax=Cytospora schulzeri TaxID=448051 RepID=A0A423WDP1_9PEZI|nr:hypothetical protein VMCG_05974 [Valsa malicola]
MVSSGRLEPCRLLQQNKISCSLWYEDAIAHYGVPTVLFDLYIVVPDIDIAAKLLRRFGWSSAPPRDRDMFHFLNSSTNLKYSRLAPPGLDQATAPRTILLCAHDWNLTAEQLRQSTMNGFYPFLAVLLDGLIGGLLNSTEDDLQCHLSVQVSYVYAHVPQVKYKTFVEKLSPQHRQFHLDCLAGMAIGTLPFLVHERQVRAELLAGTHQLKRCSASQTAENSALFGM